MPIQVSDTANQFRGKVVEIVLGSVVAEVEVETPGGKVGSVIKPMGGERALKRKSGHSR